MGMVAMLILVDMLVLTAWNLADPIRCSRSVGAAVKVGFSGDFVGLKIKLKKLFNFFFLKLEQCEDYDT